MKVHLNARNRAHQFDARGDDKLLFTALSHAIDLPYECGSGTCGTCKARLISGEVHDAGPAAPGRKFLKNKDEFLLCQCEAKTDLMLEVASFVHTMDAGACVPRSVRGEVSKVRRLTQDVTFLTVQLEQPLDFDAGQFVMI